MWSCRESNPGPDKMQIYFLQAQFSAYCQEMSRSENETTQSLFLLNTILRGKKNLFKKTRNIDALVYFVSDVNAKEQWCVILGITQPQRSQTRRIKKVRTLGLTSETYITRPAGIKTYLAVNSSQPHKSMNISFPIYKQDCKDTKFLSKYLAKKRLPERSLFISCVFRTYFDEPVFIYKPPVLF